jgi:enoyl-CoA hydratase
MDTSGIILEKQGGCGLITLDRPSALNALTLDMIGAIAAALDSYAADKSVKTVVIRSTSARAFCAGGDIKTLYELGRAGRHDAQMAFFAAEYRLIRQIHRFPKPYVALMEGIAMGGGAGISLHGAYRVGGEHLAFAMPEVGIGFFPDVGGTFFLPRLPNRAGSYLALTGSRVGIGDAVALGLVNALVPAARFAALIARFAKGEDAKAAIAAEQVQGPEPELTRQTQLLAAFASDTLEAILGEIDAVARAGSNFARTTYKTIRARSPTSLAIAFRQMQVGRSLDLEAALRLEYRIGQRVVRGHDYYEGVRTVLIDKGETPHWTPEQIKTLSASNIDAYFAPYPGGELDFPAWEGAA